MISREPEIVGHNDDPGSSPAARAATVLVTDASRGSAIAILRSLSRKGHRVIAADSDPRSAGFRSRWVQKHLLYPDPLRAPQMYVAALLEAVERLQVGLVIPVTDEAILPLSAAREQFRGVCRLAIPDAKALDKTIDKAQTLELAAELGVPVPRTRRVESSADGLCCAGELGWPVVLKPQTSRVWRPDTGFSCLRVAYAGSLEQLRQQLDALTKYCPVLLQEYVSGTGYGVELLVNRGVPLAGFQHRRMREVPLEGGVSSCRESVPPDPQLVDYARRLLDALEWTGLAMVEFKVGPKGPVLMEINGRVWGSLPLAVHSGMDFPAKLADLYLADQAEMPAIPDFSYVVGVRSRNVPLELAWIAHVLLGRRSAARLPIPPRRQALSALISLLNPSNRFDVASFRDPWPAMAAIRQVFVKAARKLRGTTR